MLLNYRKYDNCNPYTVQLSILDDELALHVRCHFQLRRNSSYRATVRSLHKRSTRTTLSIRSKHLRQEHKMVWQRYYLTSLSFRNSLIRVGRMAVDHVRHTTDIVVASRAVRGVSAHVKEIVLQCRRDSPAGNVRDCAPQSQLHVDAYMRMRSSALNCENPHFCSYQLEICCQAAGERRHRQ